jgi:hypothetical protein
MQPVRTLQGPTINRAHDVSRDVFGLTCERQGPRESPKRCSATLVLSDKPRRSKTVDRLAARIHSAPGIPSSTP